MSVPPVSPNEILNPIEKLIENNVYFVKMQEKAIGRGGLPYRLITKDENDENGIVYFKFERIDRGHTFNIRKDDIDNYRFIPVTPAAPVAPEASKPPARPEGGRRRRFKKSSTMRRGITKILSRKFKTRRFRKH